MSSQSPSPASLPRSVTDAAAHEGYVEGFRRRAAAEREALIAARDRAREAAGSAARAVRDRFHPRLVLIIGSLPRGTWRPGSDIDLAVEGLDVDALPEAERIAAEASGGLPVDVLRLEAMTPGWRAHHQRFGEVVDAPA